MKIKSMFVGCSCLILITTGTIFRAQICNYLWGVSWNTFLSTAVFVAGSVYAIIERNFIVGLMSIGAALLLPWIQAWLTAYWPWFKANYVFF